MFAYAELHAHSAFSYLHGANQPEELVAAGKALGLHALALTDHDGFYGVVRFAQAAHEVGLKTVFGAEINVEGYPLVILARGVEGYRRLSRTIALKKLAQQKKEPATYTLAELGTHAEGAWVVLTGGAHGSLRQAMGPGPHEWDLNAGREEAGKLVDTFGPENVVV